MKQEMEEELVSNILPFWINRMTDEVNGGFYGRITGREEVKPEAEKGAILNARILWTFSAAYRLLKRPEYLETATRAKRTLIDRFYDNEFGGVYWHSFDPVKNGYCEALTREWGEIADMRLSAKDENERKTMNTHLHILEPYTNLFRVWKDTRLERQLRNLIGLFTERILNIKTGHLELFFNDDWVSKYRIVSYGHDIEASWLIHEAALVLGDKDLLEKVEPLVEYIAAAADEGLTPDGSMIYETFLDKGKTDTDRHWWVQAENVVGHANLYQHFDDEVAMQKALRCWDFIKLHLVDYKYGEWHWSVRADGTVNTDDDKAGFWKCPYHNGRMCMEIIERFS